MSSTAGLFLREYLVFLPVTSAVPSERSSDLRRNTSESATSFTETVLVSYPSTEKRKRPALNGSVKRPSKSVCVPPPSTYITLTNGSFSPVLLSITTPEMLRWANAAPMQPSSKVKSKNSRFISCVGNIKGPSPTLRKGGTPHFFVTPMRAAGPSGPHLQPIVPVRHTQHIAWR